jgi:hypothetical protein
MPESKWKAKELLEKLEDQASLANLPLNTDS